MAAVGAAEDDLVYRVYIFEPRYTNQVFHISSSHRFSKALPFLRIEKGDILGKLIICCYSNEIILKY